MNSTPALAAAPLRAPSLKRRMASFVYEALILFGIGLIPGAIGALFVAITGREHGVELRYIAFIIYGLYFTWFWSRRGQTLPMQTWRIRVVAADGRPLSQWHALARYFASWVWIAPAWALARLNGWAGKEMFGAIGVGIVAYALLALLHPQRQFWHDALCGTRLVDVPPTPPAVPPAHPA
ncbi:RDD family protein [Rhizobacter sp. SG703]|uniref:RDD family protein n=1 Tax=Rhizobacter sp. SG703 TaxID=2587140 RepID=UPI0014464997|nr:RDD family protein [Rhizobacter sp. SG703]NKI92597.1 putative RDD family membrane protein YckC [Rhizobacter sp. SG703]